MAQRMSLLKLTFAFREKVLEDYPYIQIRDFIIHRKTSVDRHRLFETDWLV